MPYVAAPPAMRRAHQGVLAATYSAIVLVGLLTLGEHPPFALQPVVGWTLAITGMVALVGAVSGYYRLEWVPLPVMTAAIFIAAIGLHASGRSWTVVLLVGALGASLLARFLSLTAAARQVRQVLGGSDGE